jgi:exopolysaccharide production protein ExoZ
LGKSDEPWIKSFDPRRHTNSARDCRSRRRRASRAERTYKSRSCQVAAWFPLSLSAGRLTLRCSSTFVSHLQCDGSVQSRSQLSTALTMLVVLGSLVSLPQPLAFLATSLTLEFCFGMLVAQLFLMGWHISSWGRVVLLVLGATVAMLCTPYGEGSPIRGIAWGLPAAAIVAAGVLTNTSPRGAIARALEALGNASYSLYLSHPLLFIAIHVAISRVVNPQRLPSTAYGIGLVVACVALALALHAWVELPMTRFLNAVFDNEASWKRIGSGESASKRSAWPIQQ